ncbi:hypothetical protein PG999_004080 [Apiospora kogelbergensis]|uniref:Uncharacterized protein n=1 Tax=Apiospora kogelbergensis TaxID=1337665 RepID=A0AAW0R5F6_9PEZI
MGGHSFICFLVSCTCLGESLPAAVVGDATDRRRGGGVTKLYAKPGPITASLSRANQRRASGADDADPHGRQAVATLECGLRHRDGNGFRTAPRHPLMQNEKRRAASASPIAALPRTLSSIVPSRYGPGSTMPWLADKHGTAGFVVNGRLFSQESTAGGLARLPGCHAVRALPSWIGMWHASSNAAGKIEPEMPI